jgi:hypothetical protein
MARSKTSDNSVHSVCIEKVWFSYMDAILILQSDRPFEDFTDDELDVLYFHVFQRKAYHMSRAGYLNYLNQKRSTFGL